jgi:putative thioredoxin
LEELTVKAEGAFRLAKVNVDENPNLALRYNVRGIPAVKGFRMGQVVSEFVGSIPKPKIEAFIRELAPSPNDLLLSKGLSLLDDNRWAEAEDSFRKVLANSESSPQILLGLAKSLLAQNKATEALEILTNFPASREFSAAEKMRPLAEALNRPASTDRDSPLEATFNRALDLVRRGNFPAALDGLLDIIREDKHYRDNEPRYIVLAIFEILGNESTLTRQYQSELASILF